MYVVAEAFIEGDFEVSDLKDLLDVCDRSSALSRFLKLNHTVLVMAGQSHDADRPVEHRRLGVHSVLGSRNQHAWASDSFHGEEECSTSHLPLAALAVLRLSFVGGRL